MNIFFSTRSGRLSLLTIVAFTMMAAAVGQTQTSTSANKAAAPSKASKSGRVVLYAAVGPELTRYDVDIDGHALVKRGSVTLPANIQAAWPHPSRKYFYVAWSNGGPSTQGDKNGLTAFRVDPDSGALFPHGQPASLPSRPIHLSTDIPGTHVLVAYTNPSGVTVHRIAPDGTIGSQVEQPAPLDVGIYGHQVRVDASNNAVFFVTRGNAPTPSKPADPGALKIFSYKDGLLTNQLSIAPGGGLNFQARYMDFHPSRPWVFVSLEWQRKLVVLQKLKDGTVSTPPLFVRDSLADPSNVRPGQTSGVLHMHPNGRFVYLANRANGTTDSAGKAVFAGGENNIAVFAINQETGEPTLIQSADAHGVAPVDFALDPNGEILVVANMAQLLDGDGKIMVTAVPNLALFSVRADGKLDYVRSYDLDAANRPVYWIGITSLP